MGHYLGRTGSVLWDTGCILNPDPTAWWLLLHGQNTQVRTGRGRSGRGACTEPLHRNVPATLSSAGLGGVFTPKEELLPPKEREQILLNSKMRFSPGPFGAPYSH